MSILKDTNPKSKKDESYFPSVLVQVRIEYNQSNSDNPVGAVPDSLEVWDWMLDKLSDDERYQIQRAEFRVVDEEEKTSIEID